ncbi:hypothetical protein EB796_010605 [Bugula neritina]|uniref:Uncharacterized protein n=1 Tax=Bugula neritina TaxID=10212 RepID=A0A7J7JXE5_BUGNE|nr:hypothetical protein EB796_010605 [Bugula neritina]
MSVSTCQRALANYRNVLTESVEDFFAFQPWKDLKIDETNVTYFEEGRTQCEILRTNMLNFTEKLENVSFCTYISVIHIVLYMYICYTHSTVHVHLLYT